MADVPAISTLLQGPQFDFEDFPGELTQKPSTRSDTLYAIVNLLLPKGVGLLRSGKMAGAVNKRAAVKAKREIEALLDSASQGSHQKQTLEQVLMNSFPEHQFTKGTSGSELVRMLQRIADKADIPTGQTFKGRTP